MTTKYSAKFTNNVVLSNVFTGIYLSKNKKTLKYNEIKITAVARIMTTARNITVFVPERDEIARMRLQNSLEEAYL
ncbi:hypothetical protein Xinn_01825 [Xenorhabdus innexi]|uniref:Uncharacterized protein n=1 Tax=Xenorhabdus innexi TaxID=290109 RepID=A0A2G0NN18_9GAMM|nr:hypothetical protein Xinn_01825 [Xenorhabdus innexi]